MLNIKSRILNEGWKIRVNAGAVTSVEVTWKLIAGGEKSMDSKISGKQSLWRLSNAKILFEIHESPNAGVGSLEKEPNFCTISLSVCQTPLLDRELINY